VIKQSSIDEVRNRTDLYDVISQFVTLKKKGNGYEACCPFHNEKSPSFRVTPAKNIYKCFGCGKSGDAIRFVVEHEKKSFVEAIEWLAERYRVTLEYDQAAQQVSEETKNRKEEMLQLVAWSQKKYEDLLFSLPDDAAVIQYMQQRGYDRQRMRQWSMGFAPDDWKFLTTPIINMGKHGPAVDCGLVYSKEGKNFDFLRNRITIPIHDHNGILIGLAGRMIPTGDEAADKKQAKYFNPCESIIYSKKKVWYGLWQALKAIREREFAYVVEGYMDVQAMHDAELENTVASSGTEIDELQVKLLKRYTDHVVMCYDNDTMKEKDGGKNTGRDKAMKQINLFLKHNYKVSVVDLPEGKDPDEYIRSLSLTTAKEFAV
jgi:DNA primase